MRFKPSSVGPRSVFVQIPGADGKTVARVSLQGTGTQHSVAAPQIAVPKVPPPIPVSLDCTVPQLVGLSLEAAKSAIAGTCAVVGGTTRGEPSLAVTQSTVTSSDPPAGVTIAKGRAIALATSQPGVNVPKVDVDDGTH